MRVVWELHRLLHQFRHALITPSRNARSAVVLGRILAVAFLICFFSGLYSHFLQDPLPGMVFPTRPIWLYQITQGLHISAGIACFPLLFGKLYAVFPELFRRPPVRSFAHLLERGSIALFVGTALVQIVIGLLNTYQFYVFQPFPFPFREVHFALSFVVIGSLAIHIGVKLPLIAQYWTRRRAYAADGAVVEHEPDEDAAFDAPDELRRLTGRPQNAGITGRIFEWIDKTPAPLPPDPRARVSRRAFFAGVIAATGASVTLTAGQSFGLFDGVNFFGPRKSGVGPQSLSVNRTAKAAGVVEAATAADWTLTVANGSTTRVLTYRDLAGLRQYQSVLPIACVEGWSQYATWAGPRLRDLLDLVGAHEAATIRITSLQHRSPYAVTEMGPEFARDELTLVALQLEGENLDLDHGYPARIIAPARPGVLQTKWLTRLEVI